MNGGRGPLPGGQAAREAGAAASRERDHGERSGANNAKWRAGFRAAVEKAGIGALPSVVNFVVLRLAGGPAQAEAALAATRRQGILLRGMASYGLADCLRVTIGTEEDMRATADALAEAVQ